MLLSRSIKVGYVGGTQSRGRPSSVSPVPNLTHFWPCSLYPDDSNRLYRGRDDWKHLVGYRIYPYAIVKTSGIYPTALLSNVSPEKVGSNPTMSTIGG